MSLRESCMRENRTYSLSGGRRRARKRASSDPTAEKVPNNRRKTSGGTGGKAADQGERNERTHEPDTEPGNRVKGLQGVREAAQRDKGLRFTTLLHHVNERLLLDSFYLLNLNSEVEI